tara:strand:+ start:2114 stop:2278 length:165 start_codon:yes stop_codon:yes gene_type:complete
MKIRLAPLEAALLLGCRALFLLHCFSEIQVKFNLIGDPLKNNQTLFALKSFSVF